MAADWEIHIILDVYRFDTFVKAPTATSLSVSEMGSAV